MSISCNVIRDLLPLYAENLASEESKAMVNDHLTSCENCRRALEELRRAPALPRETDTAKLNHVRKEIRRRRLLWSLLALLVTATILVGVFLKLTTRRYLKGASVISVTELENGRLAVTFREDVEGYWIDYDQLDGMDGGGTVATIYTWRYPLGGLLGKNLSSEEILLPAGLTLVQHFYPFEESGSSTLYLWGEQLDGEIVPVPRMVLGAYFFMALGAALVLGVIAWAVLSRSRNSKPGRGLAWAAIYCLCFAAMDFFIMEGDFLSFEASERFVGIFLLSALLWGAALTGWQLARTTHNKK